MPTTLNPVCPLCGLRFANEPLLDLHFREDHRQRDIEPEPHNPAATPSPTSNEATTRPARRDGGAGRARTALRRALRAVSAGEHR